MNEVARVAASVTSKHWEALGRVFDATETLRQGDDALLPVHVRYKKEASIVVNEKTERVWSVDAALKSSINTSL